MPRLCIALAAATFFVATNAAAAPEVRLLGVEGRSGAAEGKPILTTLFEVGEVTSTAEVVAHAGCGALRGDKQLDCIADALGHEHAQWTPTPFSQTAIKMFVKVDIQDLPLVFESRESFNGPTAWLVALDSSTSMGASYADARDAAKELTFAVGSKDSVRLVVFDDRVVADSKWVPAGEKQKLSELILANSKTSPPRGGNRSLADQVKTIMNSFSELPSMPLHRVMIVLSNAATNDTNFAMKQLAQRATKGRVPEDDPTAPKIPIAMVPVLVPPHDVTRGLALMEDLANPEVGGRFEIMRAGQGIGKANRILSALWQRTSTRSVVRWRLPCIATTAQTFQLMFQGATADATFKEVPIGVEPAKWPLFIENARIDYRQLHVTGSFCWGADKSRAAVQFLRGDVRVPASAASDESVDVAVPEESSIVEGDRIRFKVIDDTTKRESPVLRLRVSRDSPETARTQAPPATTAAPPAKAGCGCDVVDRSPAGAGLGALVTLASALLRRRRGAASRS